MLNVSADLNIRLRKVFFSKCDNLLEHNGSISFEYYSALEGLNWL